MYLKQLTWAILFLPVLSISGIAEQASSRPEGRYCGNVLHNGEFVYSEVELVNAENGYLNGIMRYHDNDAVTEGTVEETKRDALHTRTIQWADKYGYGFAILNFNKDFSSFEGVWGTAIQTPRYTWTGKRCHDLTS